MSSRLAVVSALAGRYWRHLPSLVAGGLRLALLTDYHLDRTGRAGPPLSLNLELTARCNLHCRMCWLWGENGVGAGFAADELDTATILRVIDEIHRYHPLLHLQGGEIFVRRDIVDILRRLNQRRFTYGFTTNATLLTPESAREAVRGSASITVSLDGPESRHDDIRGPGTFARAVAGLQLLLAARDRRALPRIRINTFYPGLTETEMVEFVRFAADLGVDAVKFGDLQFLTPARAAAHKQVMKRHFDIDCRSVDGYVGEPRDDPAELWRRLAAVRRTHGTGIEVRTLKSQSALERWYTGTARDTHRYCFAPWFSAEIRADGSVIPCGEYHHAEYVAGNIRTQPFREIWNGARMRRFRQVLKEVKLFPGCDRCCGLDTYGRPR